MVLFLLWVWFLLVIGGFGFYTYLWLGFSVGLVMLIGGCLLVFCLRLFDYLLY